MAATSCKACGNKIRSLDFMECVGCQALFDLECVSISHAAFEEFTQEAKEHWTCPICISARPKGGNLNTPIRTSIGGWNATYVAEINTTMTDNDSDNINPIRGNRGGSFKNDSLIQMRENSSLDGNLSEVLLGIRNDLQLLKTQNEEILPLRRDVQRLTNVVKDMSESIMQLRKSLEDRDRYIKNLEGKLAGPIRPGRYSEDTVVKTKQSLVETSALPTLHLHAGSDNEVLLAPLPHKNLAAQPESSKRPSYSTALSSRGSGGGVTGNEEVGARKQTGGQNERTTSTVGEGGEWNVVQNRKKKLTEVKKGGNTGTMQLKGAERKKFLHVWRLRKTTTEKELAEYVISVVGHEDGVKVDKIKTKTERDYASYIIGVPESSYEKLCQSEVWPIYVEFAEWIWFRKERASNVPRETKSLH